MKSTRLGRLRPNERRRMRSENRAFAKIAHESCVLIKSMVRLLHRHKSRTGLWRPLICRNSGYSGSRRTLAARKIWLEK